MAQTQPNLEDLALTLSRLSNINSANRSYQTALRSSDIELMERASEIASSVITNGDIPELLLNSTPQAFNREVSHYRQSNAEEFNQAFQASREKLLDFYVQFISQIRSQIREEVTKEISKDEKLKAASDKEKQKVIEQSMYQNMYQNLALMLSDFELNPEFKEDRDLVETYQKYKELKEAGPEELSRKTADIITSSYKLSSNARNLMNDWSQYSDRIKRIYGRMLAKTLLNENLELDRNKFDKAFGTMDNYAQIASIYLTKQKATQTKE